MGAPRDPARRPPPEPVGTGIIRGHVVASDTGAPVRRSNVTLLPAPPLQSISTALPLGTATTTIVNGSPVTTMTIRPRTTTTDAQGGFEFTALPAGSYRLTAGPGQYSAAYLSIAYGAKRPNSPTSNDPGTPIQLSDGQAFDKAVLTLPRGAVITGRVTDENGDPLARVQVYTLLFTGGSRTIRTGGNAQTDDLGQFRLFGLTPGDYTVAAEARGNTFVAPNAPPEREEDKIGLITTYYPGTADEASAQRVRTRAGSETPGVEIRMVSGRLFRISGMMTNSQGRPLTGTSGNLMKRMPGGSVVSSFGFTTDDQGRFQMRNLPPGSYRLGVQQRAPQINPDGSKGAPGELVNMLLTVNSDLEDLLIVTTPGATVTGQIVFEQGPPQPSSNPLRVSAQMGNPEDMMGMMMPQPAVVGPDLTFAMNGMLGEFVLRASAPNQYLKAVMLGGEDITDTPREFKSGDRVTIVLTTRASIVEGNVTDAGGQPVSDAGLIVFSEDKAAWRMTSFKTRRTGVDANGHYRLTGLMPGRYFAAAVSRDQLNVQSNIDAAFFEQLAKEATSFVIGEDDQRQVDLKLLTPGGGD